MTRYDLILLFIALVCYLHDKFKKTESDLHYIKNRVYDIEERLKERGFKLPEEKKR